LAPQPRLITADEPLSGADVSITARSSTCCSTSQASGIAYLLITHDIRVARAFVIGSLHDAG
jgi:ABC-type glutathione transport system ATPase component